MSKFSWRMLGLAAIVAGGTLGVASSPASAVILPMTSVPAANSASISQEVADRHRDRRDGRRFNYRHRNSRYYGQHPFYHHRHYGQRRPGFSFYFGGWWYAQPWWRTNPRAGGNAHVSWCLNRYRSYNPATNMYLGFDGMHHRCRSPYRR
jgi:hypothetical protein